MEYKLDLNTDRCIYEDRYGRQYLITDKEGHHYSGDPVKITVGQDELSYQIAGETYTYSKEKFSPLLLKGNFDKDNEPTALVSLSFDSLMPIINDHIVYEWPTGESTFQVFPN